MSYATVADLYRRYNKRDLHLLAEAKVEHDDDGQPLQSVESILEEALADASVTIDGYIDGRTALPLKQVPAPLVRITCVLARYALTDDVATEKVEKDNEAALRYLEKVSTGDISLGLSVDAERPEGGDVAIMSSSGSVWSRECSKGYI